MPCLPGHRQFHAHIVLNEQTTKTRILVRHLRRHNSLGSKDEAVDLLILDGLCSRALECGHLPIWRRILCHVILAICAGVDAQMQLEGARAILLVVEHEMRASVDHDTQEFKSTRLLNLKVLQIFNRLDELCSGGGDTRIDFEWWMLDPHECKQANRGPVDERDLSLSESASRVWHLSEQRQASDSSELSTPSSQC